MWSRPRRTLKMSTELAKKKALHYDSVTIYHIRRALDDSSSIFWIPQVKAPSRGDC